ncbi:MAG: YciI family protein [Opitutaceae bacterium]
MPSRAVLVLAVLSLTLVPARAVEHEAPRKIKVVVAPPVTDPDLTTYYIGLLSRGPRAGEGTRDERKKTHAAQSAYLTRLSQEGKLLVSGPLVDDSPRRGIYIFKCATQAEAELLAADDPEVKAGRLAVEVHTWLTEKGAIRDPAFSAEK